MKNRQGTRARTLLIAALAVAIGVGWCVRPRPARFDPLRAVEQVEARFAEYREARFAEDYEKQYELLTPEHKKVCSLTWYIEFYGSGIMQPLEMELVDAKLNVETRTVDTTVRTRGKMLIERLPPKFRSSMVMPDDPADLENEFEHPIRWVWSGGEWGYTLEEEAVNSLAQAKGGK